jgi:hypothetical protein
MSRLSGADGRVEAGHRLTPSLVLSAAGAVSGKLGMQGGTIQRAIQGARR